MEHLDPHVLSKIINSLPARTAVRLSQTSSTWRNNPDMIDKMKQFKKKRVTELLFTFSIQPSMNERTLIWNKLMQHYIDVLNDIVSNNAGTMEKSGNVGNAGLHSHWHVFRMVISHIYSSYNQLLMLEDDPPDSPIDRLIKDTQHIATMKSIQSNILKNNLCHAIQTVLNHAESQIGDILESSLFPEYYAFMIYLPKFASALYKYADLIGINIDISYRKGIQNALSELMEQFSFCVLHHYDRETFLESLQNNNVDNIFDPFIQEFQQFQQFQQHHIGQGGSRRCVKPKQPKQPKVTRKPKPKPISSRTKNKLKPSIIPI